MLSSDCDSVRWLDKIHFDAINQSLRNVLATDLALQTFAQIIDGLPLAEAARQSSHTVGNDHPINSHVVLCDGVMEKAVQVRRDLDLTTLKFSSKLLEAYQASARGSRALGLRLIELTAAALHQIAVLLFQQDILLHDPATTEGLDVYSTTSWERPPDQWARVVPYATLFTQRSFTAYQQYPNGIADMVGYWAEDRILGGVALFDHSQLWNIEDNEPNVYFQSGRVHVTSRICQLLDAQQEELLRFLLADPKQSRDVCPLPVLPSRENRVRIDWFDAIPRHKVYRDLWEREERKLDYRMDRSMGHRARNSLDYPEVDVSAEIAKLNAIWRRENE